MTLRRSSGLVPGEFPARPETSREGKSRHADPNTLRAHLAMMGFAVLIAGSFSLGSLAAPHIGAAALNAVRFVLGTLFMGVFAFVRLGGNLRVPSAPWRFLVLGGLMAVYFVTMFVALGFTSPVSTGAVFTLIPLMSAGFGLMILGQKPKPVVLLSLLVAGLGAVWVIFRGSLHDIVAFNVGRGEMIFFVGCVCHAIYPAMVRKLNRGEPAIAFTLWTLAGTAVVIALVGIPQIVTTPWLNLPPIVWAAIAYLSVFTTAATFFLLQYASLRLPPAKVLAYGYLTPTFIILLEGVSGHGWVSLSVLAGAVVTVVGLVILALAPDV